MKKLLLLFLIPFSISTFGQDNSTKTTIKGYSQHLKGAHNVQFGIGYPNLQGFYYQTQSSINQLFSQFNTSEKKKGFSTPDFTLKYEYGLLKNVGIGLHLGYFYAKSPTLNISNIAGGGSTVNQLLCDLFGGDFCNPDGGSDSVQGEVFKRTHSVSVAGRFVYHVPLMKLLFKQAEVSQEHDEALSKVVDSYISTVIGYSFVNSKEVGNVNDQSSGGTIEELFPEGLLNDNGSIGGVPVNFIYQVSAGVKYHFNEQWGIYGEVGYGTLGLVNIGATYRIIPDRLKQE